ALDGLSATERTEMEPADPLSADRLYERRWASVLMEQVLRRLKDEYRTAGNGELFDWLKQLLPDEPGAPSRAEIAARLGMTENAVRQAFHRFRHRYHVLLREEIGHTVAIASDIEDELRHLIDVLRAQRMIEFRAVQDRVRMDDSPVMSSVLRVCRKCGAKIFADAPEGLC